jgi:hypothetical protein
MSPSDKTKLNGIITEFSSEEEISAMFTARPVVFA